MSRPLKFRVWDENAKKWLTKGESLECEITNNFTPEISVRGDMRGFIEQYTGLKDKNGKEIYEGDIVVLSPEIRYVGSFLSEKNEQKPLVVEFDDGEWLLSEMPHKTFQNILYQEEDFVEVIGNIHENPELLEKDNGRDK